MSFVLRSSKFVSSVLKCHRQIYIVRVQNQISCLQKQNKVPINCRLVKEFSTPAPKVDDSQVVTKYINRLDSSLSIRQKVSIQDVKELLKVLKLCGSVSNSQSLLLLKCCNNLSPDESPQKKIKFTNEVWFALETLGAEFDTGHYNALLKAYMDYGYKFSPNKFLSDMKAAEVLPDMLTYQHLLKAYCQLGDIQGASNLLEKMKNEELPINEDIFNSLVYGHCQINDLESANGIIALMKNKGINPSSETYSHLMCYHAKKGEMNEVEKILSENKEEIFFSDKDLLNVLYVLAENGYSEHIDKILKKVKKSVGYNVHAADIIHRLLHKKLDSEAIKVFTTLKEAAFHIRENFMIENVAKTRSCKEILEFCEKIEKEELVPSATYDGLREILRFRDEATILEFFGILNEKNMTVESHYFWPLLIKASKGGNKSLLDVLAKMKRIKAPRCRLTHTKVILPNFKFDSNWKKQIDTLSSLSVPEHLISSHLFLEFLNNEDIKAAEKLATSRPVTSLPKTFPSLLVHSLKTSEDVDSFVQILYCLYHDFTVQKSQTDNNPAEDLSPKLEVDAGGSVTPNFDELVKSIFAKLLQSCDENILLSILKGMLDKKIGLTSGTSELICRKFDKPAIVDIVKQLTSPDLKPQLDENIISQKNKWIGVGNFGSNKELLKAIQTSDLPKALTIWEEIKHEPSAERARLLAFFIKQDVEKGWEIFKEVISIPGAELNKNEQKRLFRFLIRTLADKGDIEKMREVFEFGRQCNLLMDNDFEALIKGLSDSNELEKAVDLFCEAATKYNRIIGYSDLALKLIKAQNAECLEKLTNTVANMRGEYQSLILLLFHFAEAGHVKQVQKLLETQDLNLSIATLRKECRSYFRKKSTTFFETLLAATKSFPGGYRKILFQYLYYLYILKGDLDKAKDLWLQIETEDNPEYLPLLKEIESFFQKEEVFDARSIKTIRHKENLERLVNQYTDNERYLDGSLIDSVEVTTKGINLILQDQVEEFSKLFSRYRNRQWSKEICNYFVLQGKLDSYLKFLKKALTEKSFVYFFCTDEMFKALLENKNLMEEFKDLAYDFKERGLTHPLRVLWECYMFSPEYRKKAEELYQNYFFGKDLCSYKRLHQLCRSLNNFNALKSVTESELFKSVRSLNPSKCYSTLINHHVKTGDLDTALSYLEKAVSDNYGDFIDQGVLARLATSVKNSGKDFPYEHLLDENKSKTQEIDNEK